MDVCLKSVGTLKQEKTKNHTKKAMYRNAIVMTTIISTSVCIVCTHTESKEFKSVNYTLIHV